MLFDPIRIRNLSLPNRIMRSATWEGMAEQDGTVTDRQVALYDGLARGGVGLIIAGFSYVLPQGKALPGQTGIYSDDQIDGLRRMTRVVREHGGRIAAQIVDAGVQTRTTLIRGETPRGPSAVTNDEGMQVAREMTEAEIGEVVQAHGAAAVRARDAGFDAIQLHVAHGYLLSQFLSPDRNRRTDRYGGSAENRRRAPLLAFHAVREAVGPKFPVLVKINCADFTEGGLEVEESLACARALQEAGLDCLEVSGGVPAAGPLGSVRPKILKREDEAHFRSECRLFKQALDIPVFLVGGLRSPDLCEEILSAGDADGVSLSRPFIREPDLPDRWRAGETARSGCISCIKCLKAGVRGGIACVDAQDSAGK